MTEDQTARYLALLDVHQQDPSLASLTELVTAHLARVPFENVSKLIRHARGMEPVLVPLDEFLDGIERSSLGGTCYPCAGHFNALVRQLGYDAWLCGGAMDQPDVHLINVVALDGREFLVDVGYAAPFFAPLHMDSRVPQAATCGRDVYLLHPREDDGSSRIEHRRDGEVIHGYVIDPTPRDIGHFAPVIADSYRPEDGFLNRLHIVRHRNRRSVMLNDFKLTIVDGEGVRSRALADEEAVVEAVEEMFGIPAPVTREAVAALAGRGAW
jgi:arylamine N-acetyltransferase